MGALDDKFEQNMHAIAVAGEEPIFAPTGRIRKQRGVSRGDVISTFDYAFQLIGGVPRLAIWADANPTDFFKLYGRLLPSSSSSELDGPQELIIKHVLQPPAYNASQDNRTQLPSQGDIRSLPPPPPEMGSTRSTPARRKDSSDDK